MKLPLIRSTVPGALLAALIALPAAAETTPIRQAEISAQLYALGIETGDPLTVLTAAKLRRDLGFIDAEAGHAERFARLPPDKRRDVAQGMGRPGPLGFDEMLGTARDLAAGDPLLIGLISDVENEATKGVATGQVYSISTIRDGGTDTYDPLPFEGGEYAEVYVESRDGSDLNLFIYDAKGRLVCSDTDISAISYCGWRPDATGAFTIEVKNRGRGGAGYSLMTN